MPRWTAQDTADLIRDVLDDDLRSRDNDMPGWRKDAESLRQVVLTEYQKQQERRRVNGFTYTARIRGDDPIANQHTIDQLTTTIEQLWDLLERQCSSSEGITLCGGYHTRCATIESQRKVIMDRLTFKLDQWEKAREHAA